MDSFECTHVETPVFLPAPLFHVICSRHRVTMDRATNFSGDQNFFTRLSTTQSHSLRPVTKAVTLLPAQAGTCPHPDVTDCLLDLVLVQRFRILLQGFVSAEVIRGLLLSSLSAAHQNQSLRGEAGRILGSGFPAGEGHSASLLMIRRPNFCDRGRAGWAICAEVPPCRYQYSPVSTALYKWDHIACGCAEFVSLFFARCAAHG